MAEAVIKSVLEYKGVKYIIEVHGGQHYDIKNGFNRNEEDFINRYGRNYL